MGEKRNFSAKREAIYEAIAGMKSHPSAEQVYERLRDDIPDLSLGTVYRNVALFRKSGRIKSVGVWGGHERFDAELSDHAHFVCTGCYEIRDIFLTDSSLEKSLVSQLESEGCTVTSSSLVFCGLCERCKGRQ